MIGAGNMWTDQYINDRCIESQGGLGGMLGCTGYTVGGKNRGKEQWCMFQEVISELRSYFACEDSPKGILNNIQYEQKPSS